MAKEMKTKSYITFKFIVLRPETFQIYSALFDVCIVSYFFHSLLDLHLIFLFV